MADEFDGKVAIVTGGSSGIGRATAIAFGKAGAKVVVADRRDFEGEETVSQIKLADLRSGAYVLLNPKTKVCTSKISNSKSLRMLLTNYGESANE